MKSRSLRYLIQVTKLSAIGILFVAGTHFFILQPSEVNGRSMENTLVDGDVIFIDKVSLLFREPKRGEIISVIRKGHEEKLVKRVIGLPGEQVILQDGEVYVLTAEYNLVKLEEPYLRDQAKTFPPVGTSYTYPVVPEHSVFILGDNRQVSFDSRSYGSVHRTEIIGIIRQFFE